MSVSLEPTTIIHGEDGEHAITLPCCGETVDVRSPTSGTVCRSCHREVSDGEDLGSDDPPICVICYTA